MGSSKTRAEAADSAVVVVVVDDYAECRAPFVVVMGVASPYLAWLVTWMVSRKRPI